MSEITSIAAWNKRGLEDVRELLHREGLTLDPHLDYTAALY